LCVGLTPPSSEFKKSVDGFCNFQARRTAVHKKFLQFWKKSTAARRVNEKPEPKGLWFFFGSGGWIRTTDLRVMSNAPESVLFVRRVMQISQTDERWFLLARHAAVVDRYSYSSPFAWVRQVLI
jgi:hypothetical protein